MFSGGGYEVSLELSFKIMRARGLAWWSVSVPKPCPRGYGSKISEQRLQTPDEVVCHGKSIP
jgi:hypothetical protein